MMEKEEILAKNLKDNRVSDEYEMQVLGRAGTIATALGGLFCVVFAALEYILTSQISCSYWAIYFAMLTCEFSFKSFKFHRTHEILFTVCYAILTIACTTAYILQLIGVLA